MARTSKRFRRRWRRHLRTALFIVLLFGALPGLTAAGVSGELGMLWLIPAGMAAALLAVPMILLGVAVLAAISLPVVALAMFFGAPMVLAYRILGGRQREAERLPEEVTLRRRYVAGELSYEAFRDGMLASLKERVARGELSLPAYEAELERLLRPGREMDAGRDPSLAGALRAD